MENNISTKSALSVTDSAVSASENGSWLGNLGLGYLFASPGATTWQDLLALIVVVSLIFFLGLASFIVRARKKSLTPPQRLFLSRLGWSLISFGIIGGLLVVVRVFGFPVVSIRFLWIVWLLALAFVTFRLFRYFRFSLPDKINQYQAYQVKNRYLPHKNSKKKKR